MTAITSMLGSKAGGQAARGIGGILGAIGSYQDAIAAAEALRFQARQARDNVELVEKDQQIIAEASAQERAAISKESSQVRAANQASFAAGNVLTGEGSALDVDLAEADRAAAAKSRSKQEEIFALQRGDIEKEGLLKEARQARKAAKRAKRSGTLKLIGGIIGSIG